MKGEGPVGVWPDGKGVWGRAGPDGPRFCRRSARREGHRFRRRSARQGGHARQRFCRQGDGRVGRA
eukprot:9819976-Lingulodinium_polyedra.AAC.1